MEEKLDGSWLLDKVLQNNSDIRSSTKRKVILISTGALNPIHRGHIEMFQQTKLFLEENFDFDIIGGFISPTHDSYVRSKCSKSKAFYLNSDRRIHLVQIACKDSLWLECGTWEASQDTFVDFPEVVDSLIQSLARVDPPLLHENLGEFIVLYVCGYDHYKNVLRFDQDFQQSFQMNHHFHTNSSSTTPYSPPSSRSTQFNPYFPRILLGCVVVGRVGESLPPSQSCPSRLVFGVTLHTPLSAASSSTSSSSSTTSSIPSEIPLDLLSSTLVREIGERYRTRYRSTLLQTPQEPLSTSSTTSSTSSSFSLSSPSNEDDSLLSYLRSELVSCLPLPLSTATLSAEYLLNIWEESVHSSFISSS